MATRRGLYGGPRSPYGPAIDFDAPLSEAPNEWYNGQWWRSPTYGGKWYGSAGNIFIENYTVRFNAEVTYTGANPTAQASGVEGLEFTRDTVQALDVRHLTDMNNPSEVIQYQVYWPSATIAGQAVRFEYTGAAGAYENSEGLAMADQNLLLENCADP